MGGLGVRARSAGLRTDMLNCVHAPPPARVPCSPAQPLLLPSLPLVPL